jgi:ParB-like chromosome segregation protein Spo0J
MKQTVTILDRKNRIALFRLPKPGSVAHRHLSKGLTVLGDGDILRLPFEPHDKEAARRFADGCALDEVATVPNWLLNYGAGAAVRVIEVRDIKITDIVVDPNHRPLIPEKVSEIAESMAEIRQMNPITVTPRKDGKFDLVSGNHRREAAETLGWTQIRAQIVEGEKTEVRLWAIADDLHRAGLTVLQEAERTAEWVRTVEARARVYRQKTANPKTGRPEGAVAKAARELPVKGKTQQARRKAIERDLKIASITQEAKFAANEAGLDRTALREVAKQATAEAQVEKIQEIVKRKAAGRSKALTRSAGKKKTTKTKRSVPKPSLSSKDVKVLARLMKPWNDTPELKRGYPKASQLVRDTFKDKIDESVSDDDDRETELEPAEHDEDGDETQQVDDTDSGDDADHDDNDGAKPKTKKGKKASISWCDDDDDDNDENDESDDDEESNRLDRENSSDWC